MPRLALLACSALLALACGDATGPGASTLTPGESRQVRGRTNSALHFQVTVPPGTGTLQVLLTGGTGDADIVVRHGARPEPGLFDCVSAAADNEEECLFDAPAAGTWYVMVVGTEPFTAARLVANLGAVAGAIALESGVPVTGLAGGAGSFRMFRIDVPANATSLDVTLDGDNGDADLYLRRGTFPRLNQYDRASFDDGSTERTLQWSPAAGTWYVRVEGFTPYAGVTLRATVTTAADAPATPAALSAR